MSDEPSAGGLNEAIVGTITQPLLVLNGDLRVELANPAFLRAFEVPAEEAQGRRVYELGNGQWDIPELRRLLEEVLSGDKLVEGFRVEHAFKEIGQRTMLLNANRMRRGGAPDRILLAITDVTERERLLDELTGQKEFGDKLIDSVREALLVLDWDLRVIRGNQSFYDHFDVSPEDACGRMVYELGNGQWDIPELRTLLENVLPDNNAFDDFEVEHEFERIGRRVMLLNGRRLDHINQIVLAIRDVTEARAHEWRQQTVVGELQHRVRNVLNNVNALATQTARRSTDVDSFLAAFTARLGALGRAQDMLVRTPSGEIALDYIIHLELGAVGAEEGRDFTLEGPEVRLAPDSAQAMAMAVHELTTNAGKHGALKAGGRIEIGWRIEAADGETQLNFRWREYGVQIEETRPEKSFGWRVIEEHLPSMLGGTAKLMLRPEGLDVCIEFPV
jgi:two-component sensor histidine kinase/PAS domain-containing protein